MKKPSNYIAILSKQIGVIPLNYTAWRLFRQLRRLHRIYGFTAFTASPRLFHRFGFRSVRLGWLRRIYFTDADAEATASVASPRLFYQIDVWATASVASPRLFHQIERLPSRPITGQRNRRPPPLRKAPKNAKNEKRKLQVQVGRPHEYKLLGESRT